MIADFKCDYISDQGSGTLTFSLDFPDGIPYTDAIDQALQHTEQLPCPSDLPDGTDFEIFNVRLA